MVLGVERSHRGHTRSRPRERAAAQRFIADFVGVRALGRAHRDVGGRRTPSQMAAATGGRAGSGQVVRHRAGKKVVAGNMGGRMARSGSRYVLGRAESAALPAAMVAN